MDFDHNEATNEEAEISKLRNELEEAKSDRDDYKEAVIFMKEKLSEVNLLNAKLLYANRLFRVNEMTNEEKTRVIETLDRTNSVREVKLVFSTLAESIRFNSKKPVKRAQSNIVEGLSSKSVGSTAPNEKAIISEADTSFDERMKYLAGIIK